MADKKTVDDVLDLLREATVVGLFIFGDVAKTLAEVAGLGGLVKALLEFIPENDPIMDELKKLEGKIDELSKHIDSKFADLKSFLVELNFDTEILEPTSRLTMFMRDCLSDPCKDSKNNFEGEYKKNSPLTIAYSLLAKMKKPETNPLIMAMGADDLKTTATFEKWQKIIGSLLGQLLFLESFAVGLLKEKDQLHDTNMLKINSEAELKEIETLKDAYKNGDEYWPGLEAYVKKFMESNKDMSNEKKSNELKKTLDTILTNDAFMIMVSKDHEYMAGNEKRVLASLPKQTMMWNEENQMVVIYRSKHANSFTEEEYKTMRGLIKQIDIKMDDVFEFMDDFLGRMFEKYFPGSGVLIVAHDGLDVQWRCANWSRDDVGPGAFTRVDISGINPYEEQELNMFIGMK